MKEMPIRGSSLLHYVGYNVELLNGLCFVQIRWFFVDIQPKVMSMENRPSLTNFTCLCKGGNWVTIFLSNIFCSFLYVKSS